VGLAAQLAEAKRGEVHSYRLRTHPKADADAAVARGPYLVGGLELMAQNGTLHAMYEMPRDSEAVRSVVRRKHSLGLIAVAIEHVGAHTSADR
jgi:hypothetical protein